MAVSNLSFDRKLIKENHDICPIKNAVSAVCKVMQAGRSGIFVIGEVYRFCKVCVYIKQDYAISRMRLTISMALSAQSEPLFPAFVPARSMACSMFSVVTTPNITGMPVERET